MLTRRFVLVLAVVTVVTTLAAGAAQYARWQDTIRDMESAPAFPAFADTLTSVTRVKIERAGDNELGSFSFERDGDLWVMASKGGYPARQSIMREMLLGFSELQLVEAKTRAANRHAKLALSDISLPGSKATRVVVEGEGGAVLLDALFGKRVPSLSGGTPSVYMRKSGDPQSWLASGELEIRGGRLDWLRIQLLKLTRERIALTTIAFPDAPPLRLYYDKQLRRFDIQDMAEDREVKSRYEMLQVGIISERLALDDVRPAEGLLADSALGGAVWETTDGLTATLVFAPDDTDPAGKPWGMLSVETSADAEEKVTKEAATIRARTAGWAYRFSDQTMKWLRTPEAMLTKPKAGS